MLKTDCCFFVCGGSGAACSYYAGLMKSCNRCDKYYPKMKIPPRIANFTENIIRGIVDQTLIEKEIVLYADAIRKDILQMIETFNNSAEGE